MAETRRRALITGVAGQDGGYLAEHLLDRGYEVFGLALPGEEVAGGLDDGDHVLRGSLTDSASLEAALRRSGPAEVYNLAAATSVAASFLDPFAAAEVTGLGVLRLLEAVRRVDPTIRLLQATSSEIFAGAEVSPQDERTPLSPRSPYGVAKAFAHQMMSVYRESHGLFAATAILYNHESPRRGLNFVTRKVTDAAARISLGLQEELRLGNLEVSRDWGYAPDYVRAMRLILADDVADDFVVATGEMHSLRELLDIAFSAAGLDWRRHVVSDPDLFRPVEPVHLCGDASKARSHLGWAPSRAFDEVIREMVAADLDRLKGAAPPPPARPGPAGPPASLPRPGGYDAGSSATARRAGPPPDPDAPHGKR
ncbi:MAG: GDP-mannose 4,6-dehydratase [Candidatus Dormibacteria bacterium]|jgi:GDPmannose 4,6-dehydratase